MINLQYTNHKQVSNALKKGLTTCQQLVEYYLTQIENTQELNIYIEVFGEEALAQAQALDLKYKEAPESVGKLFGMVISIKDVLCYKDHKLTAGSKILEGFESLFTATAIQRLLDEDAIIIGRVNCDEFAMGSGNENSTYGPTRNGLDKSKVPGGSSGGSAVAVQMDTCLVSIGSDTGGSVRQPAAFCGIVGAKPTYGRISRYGLIAYASSFDQIGTLSHSVADAALVLELMAGADEWDSTVSSKAVPSYSTQLNSTQNVKIAYFEDCLNHASIDSEIKTATQELIQKLKEDGHQVEAVPFDLLEYMIPTYYVLTMAEASSNLSRYDGVHYGQRSANIDPKASLSALEQVYRKTRTESFGTEVKRRILAGTFVLSAGYYDAYYTKAQQVRKLIFDNFKKIFESYDFILIPTTPNTAFKIGANTSDPTQTYLADIFTVSANLAGIPAISIPLATHTNRLPFGVQLMTNSFEEVKLLSFAQQLMLEYLAKT
ncbi:MAG: Asp-tRNA(Asn)/Glu-tRNA(Gln) amidotransferase subunit GatA [Aureispira sp.]|nr:Asp-tRNA(Asn)/Glu-tRNA(Gln) amidotransferase subunit GatA [Aureispira sp.]